VPFEGIVGLSFQTAYKSNTMPFMDSVINNHLLSHNIFSLFFSEENENSNIQFGEIDKNNMASNFTFVDIVSATYWEIDIEEIMIGNYTTNFCENLRSQTGRCGVAIDSGTSLYAGPTKYLKIVIFSFIYEIQEKLNIQSNCVNFKTLPDVRIKLKSRKDYKDSTSKEESEIILRPEDYIIEGKKIKKNVNNIQPELFDILVKEECRPAFMPIDVPAPRGPLFVFGEYFLRKFYTVFDRDQKVVGFSLANHEKTNPSMPIKTPYDEVNIEDEVVDQLAKFLTQ
jgi:cathepsin D